MLRAGLVIVAAFALGGCCVWMFGKCRGNECEPRCRDAYGYPAAGDSCRGIE